MNCWHCDTELIWGGDHDLEDMTDEYDVVTNLSCPNCGAYVEVYRPNQEIKKERRCIQINYVTFPTDWQVK